MHEMVIILDISYHMKTYYTLAWTFCWSCFVCCDAGVMSVMWEYSCRK